MATFIVQYKENELREKSLVIYARNEQGAVSKLKAALVEVSGCEEPADFDERFFDFRVEKY